MPFAWVAGLLAVAAAAPPSDGPATDPFAPVPPSCERLRATLEDMLHGRAGPFAREHLDEVIGEPCRRAIDDGQWPGLTRALGEPNATVPLLCLLAPPEATPVVARWLLNGEHTGDDTRCALMVLRRDPAAFEQILSGRPIIPSDRPRVDPLVSDLARTITPEERLRLLPALDLATSQKQMGRDELYALVCVTPQARSAHPCADSPPELASRWNRQDDLKYFVQHDAVHWIAAIAYAVRGIVAVRRNQRVGWQFAGIGAAAVFTFMMWSVATVPRGEGALPGFFGALLAMVLTPLAVAAGFALAWVAVRKMNASGAWMCILEAMLYVCLVFAHGEHP